jgi:hypothetical protein
VNDELCVRRIARFLEWIGCGEKARGFEGVVKGF